MYSKQQEKLYRDMDMLHEALLPPSVSAIAADEDESEFDEDISYDDDEDLECSILCCSTVKPSYSKDVSSSTCDYEVTKPSAESTTEVGAAASRDIVHELLIGSILPCFFLALSFSSLMFLSTADQQKNLEVLPEAGVVYTVIAMFGLLSQGYRSLCRSWLSTSIQSSSSSSKVLLGELFLCLPLLVADAVVLLAMFKKTEASFVVLTLSVLVLAVLHVVHSMWNSKCRASKCRVRVVCGSSSRRGQQ